MKRTVRQRYRVVPDKRQEQYFPALFGANRAVYNMFLWEREQLWAQKQEDPAAKIESMNTTISRVTAFKNLPEDKEWLTKYPAWTVQKAAVQCRDSYLKWWDSLSGKSKATHRKPRYKKRGRSKMSAQVEKPKTGFVVEKLNKNRSRIWCGKKIGWVKFKDSRTDLPVNATGLTLVQEPSGKVYASFICEQEIAEPKVTENTDLKDLDVISADLGLVDLLVWVNTKGERGKIAAPRAYRKAEKQLKKAQRRYSRKQKSSNNQEKARQKLTLLHEKVRNTRQDHQRKIASELASENQAVCLESLNVAGMVKNRHLAKSVSDAALGGLMEAVKNACEKRGTLLLQADRWAPTTKVCSQCGCDSESKSLDVRVWRCLECDAVLDRDYNAAVNIMLAAGLADSLNACGADARALAFVPEPDRVEARNLLVPAA